MKKLFKRIIPLLGSIVLLLSSFCSCAKDDIHNYTLTDYIPTYETTIGIERASDVDIVIDNSEYSEDRKILFISFHSLKDIQDLRLQTSIVRDDTSIDYMSQHTFDEIIAGKTYHFSCISIDSTLGNFAIDVVGGIVKNIREAETSDIKVWKDGYSNSQTYCTIFFHNNCDIKDLQVTLKIFVSTQSEPILDIIEFGDAPIRDYVDESPNIYKITYILPESYSEQGAEIERYELEVTGGTVYSK